MRSRSGWVVSLVFVLVVLLCLGGGAGSFLLISQLEPRGANTPRTAVDTVMRGIFAEQDKKVATRYVCPEIGDSAIEQKIDEVKDLLDKRPGTTFTWDISQKSRERTEAVYNVTLNLGDAGETSSSQKYEVTAESNGGWRVCGFKRARS
ncbi:MAG: hypothetical protein H0T78_09700 [Longispora sp.]|nr:hypothetical protein [Longispora sp. (in: high G+C Gram-positive bacteria)]